MIVTNLLNGRLATRIKSLFKPNSVLIATKTKADDGHVIRVAAGAYIGGRRFNRRAFDKLAGKWPANVVMKRGDDQ